VYLVLGVVVSLLFAYGNIYYWHGGSVVWGPRYHLPLLALLMIPYAYALSLRSILSKVWLAIWTAAGLAVQLAVSTTSWSDSVTGALALFHDETLVGLEGVPWYSWRLITRSPVFAQVVQWSTRDLDLLWLHVSADGSLASDKYLFAALGGLTCAAFVLLGFSLGWCKSKIRPQWLLISSAILVMTGVFCVSFRSGRNVNSYIGLDKPTAKQLAETINTAQASHTSVIYVSNEFFTYYWLGYLKGNFMPQWSSPIEVGHFDTLLEGVPRPEEIWLVIDRAHMPPKENPYVPRQRISRTAYELEGRWVGDYEVFRYLPPAAMRMETQDRSWVAGIQLRSIATDRQEVSAGDAIRINLVFSAPARLKQDYMLFLHLVAPDGHIITSRDGQPQYGGAPTTSWTPDQRVVERRALVVPADAPPGEYKIVCGWYTLNGIRLVPTQNEGETLERSIVVGTVTVTANQP
jgi:hypothetical protein